jgi:hypothetical protein
MTLIYDVKRAIKKNNRITVKMFVHIKESEGTMRQIDVLIGEDWNCPWYELYKKADLKIRNAVFSLAMERAKNVRALNGFYYAFNADHAETACKKGLTLARIFEDFEDIAENAKLQKTRKKAINGALSIAKSSRECSNIINTFLREDLEGVESFIEKAIEKGVSLTKSFYDDIANLRCAAYQYGDSTKKEKLQRNLFLAKCLTKSHLAFEHKRQLKVQVDFCERRGGQALLALEALLTSILEFDRYKRLCAMVPKEQKRLT